MLGGPWKLFGCLGAWKFGGPSEVLGGPCRAPAADHFFFKTLEKSGNLGHQPEPRKGIKLGACLPKQGVGRINQHATFGLLGRRDVPSPDMPPPPHVLGHHFYMLPPAAAQQDVLNPKP